MAKYWLKVKIMKFILSSHHKERQFIIEYDDRDIDREDDSWRLPGKHPD
jgi:hypothetical protein